MEALLYGSLLFFIGFIIHVIVWKLYLPKNHTKALLSIFLFTLIAGLFLLYNLNAFSRQSYLQLSVLFISLALAYVTTYSGIEVESPSLRIILMVSQAENGLSQDEIGKTLTDESLVKPRIRDLFRDKMIYLDNNKYKLTNKGSLTVRLFIFYRRLLNLGKGG